jgi:MGT family glycosyltransferase
MSGAIAVFCMRGVGHLQLLLPVIEALGARGRAVHVWTDAALRPMVERAGGRFADLFARHAIEDADPTSLPVPCRFVSFAGAYAGEVAEDVAHVRPELVVSDSFSVIGEVIARRLGVPWINVVPNHAPVPARVRAALRADPRVAISEHCLRAVDRLRELHGILDANPFCYADAISPHLNLYGEPREFLDAEERSALEPIAFFGALAPGLRGAGTEPVFPRERRGLRVYVAFGTVIWWYFAAQATAVLDAVSRACADREADVVVGLGGHRLDGAVRAALERPNLALRESVDQWAALAEADVFVTHHGLNSTHEAIFHRVPMISHPFFGDQPALARRCRDLGLAAPLGAAPGGPVGPEAVHTALEHVADARAGFAARLETARGWELRTIAERGAVIDRVLDLADGST